ncbi:hypothetical protein CBG57_08125 [Prevotella nigrescens]|nr:hypothetical protein CBG57_08125 [Prevotella nigrescens]
MHLKNDKVVSFTHLPSRKERQTLLVLLLCPCKSYQRTMPNGNTTNAPTVKAGAKVGQKIITTKLFVEKMIFFCKMYTYTNPGGIRQQGHTLLYIILYIIYRVTCTDINRHIYNK